MKKIRFSPEYHCSPIWVIDEKGGLLVNGLPSELEKEKDLADLLEEIAKEFDSLFENNEVFFGYKGFTDESAKQTFSYKVDKAIELLSSKAGKSYLIQVEINVQDL